MTEWQPVRPFGEWPVVNASPADTRESVVIPDGSITTEKVAELSVVKLKGIGIRVYNAAASNTIATGAGGEATVTMDTVDFSQDFEEPTGATFTTVTIPQSGVYLLNGVVEWASDDSNTSVWFYVNGAKKEGDSRSSDADAIASRQTVTSARRLTAGDTVGLRVRQGTGVDRDISTGTDNCSLTVVFLFAI